MVVDANLDCSLQLSNGHVPHCNRCLDIIRAVIGVAFALAIIKGYKFTVSKRLLEKVSLYLKKATSSIWR